MNPTVKLIVVSKNNRVRETVDTAKGAILNIRAGMADVIFDHCFV